MNCDWWLPTRAKCPALGSEERSDGYGAPLRYCVTHAKQADWLKTEHDERPLGSKYPWHEPESTTAAT